MTAPVENTVWQLAAPVAAGLGLRVVRVRLSGGDFPVLQIMLEPVAATPENRLSVTLTECEAFSREFSVLMDIEDPVPDMYHLEVSSTGLDRPLATLEDFAAYTPHRVKVRTKGALAGRRNFLGTLVRLEGEVLFLRLDGQDDEVEIPFAEVQNAQLAYTPQEEKALIARLRAMRNE